MSCASVAAGGGSAYHRAGRPENPVAAHDMLADPAQLDRWRRLLDVPADAVPVRTLSATAAYIDRSTALDGKSTRARLVAAAEFAAQSDATLRERLPQRDLSGPPARRPAAEGDRVAASVWSAYLESRRGSTDAAVWLRQFIDLLAPTALVFTADDNPEPWWQAEMIILHALHSFALRQCDRGLINKTLACADFHLREIQPDHATNEPWAVHAYASHTDGNVTAETLWHAAHIQHGGTPGPVARHLARDASAALAAYLDA